MKLQLFIRANTAAIIATLVDYGVTTGVLYFFKWNVAPAAALGITCGGVVNFILARIAFHAAVPNTLRGQATRYMLVWTGYLVLGTVAVSLLARVMHYAIAKIVAAILMAVLYNYPLQKNYVYRANVIKNELL